MTKVHALACAMMMATLGASTVACSDGEAPDAGTVDPDAGSPPDGGRLGLCPQEPNPACMRASDCMNDATKPTGCGGCFAYNRSLCATAMCMTPPQLEGGDPYNLLFQVGALQPELKSFAGFILSAVTAGGNTITCADVYAMRVDPNDGCYNVLDSRSIPAIAQQGDTYPAFFSRFASGQRSLFVIYGYSEENSAGNPIGVSCTEVDVGQPGVGRQNVAGDMMRRIQ